ncbi:MAG: hypothetical protein ACREMZ_16330 [Gemmatimonadales bacterium]
MGDRIVVRANWYAHSDLRNGQTGAVSAVNPGTGRLTFRGDHDGIEVVLPKRYVHPSVDYGYAQTIHTAQGHTYERVHVYVDQTMTAEHGYTGFSRASGETHIWTAELPGPLGDCTHAPSPAIAEGRTEALVRQFSRSGVRPPAADHCQAIQLLTDRELLERREELAHLISESPLRHARPDIEAIDAAISQAQAVVDRLGTSGARRQLEALTAQRRDAVDTVGEWIEDNANLLQEYGEVSSEIDRRVAARTLLYRSDPPEELLETLGPRTTASDPKAWDAAVAAYARARLKVGPDIDLSDPAIQQTGPWRDAAHQLHTTDQQAPPLRLTDEIQHEPH